MQTPIVPPLRPQADRREALKTWSAGICPIIKGVTLEEATQVRTLNAKGQSRVIPGHTIAALRAR